LKRSLEVLLVVPLVSSHALKVSPCEVPSNS